MFLAAGARPALADNTGITVISFLQTLRQTPAPRTLLDNPYVQAYGIVALTGTLYLGALCLLTGASIRRILAATYAQLPIKKLI